MVIIMDVLTRCKGLDKAIVPTLIEVQCSRCGAELELASSDAAVTCKCGTTYTNKQNAPLSGVSLASHEENAKRSPPAELSRFA